MQNTIQKHDYTTGDRVRFLVNGRKVAGVAVKTQAKRATFQVLGDNWKVSRFTFKKCWRKGEK